MSGSSENDLWAVVEVMGHKRFAGRVTKQTLAGVSFVRIDVPAISGGAGYTKLLGARAIYAITPCTEEKAIEFADRFQKQSRYTPLGLLYPNEDEDDDWDR